MGDSISLRGRQTKSHQLNPLFSPNLHDVCFPIPTGVIKRFDKGVENQELEIPKQGPSDEVVMEGYKKTNIKIILVNGARTGFWKFEWHEAGRLENLFLDIYALVSHQQKTVAGFWIPCQDILKWKGRKKGLCKLLVKEATLTHDNLMRRGIPLCPRFFFGENAETIFLNLKGISWTTHGKNTKAIYSWEEAGVQAKNRDRWRIVPTSWLSNIVINQTNVIYYRGIWHALQTISREEGIASLYKGMGATLLGVGPNLAISFSVYDTVRSYWQSHRPDDSTVLVSLACGSLSGVASSTDVDAWSCLMAFDAERQLAPPWWIFAREPYVFAVIEV
ncbi:hypothetical protein H5410_031155 [Solanum commersonii]|uniref:Mitochondrial carrier protein n=1 Tax=Solanum commersonii TaxID=4109 RepID=A0A9J5YHN4_SOLCO|nr:hypothetical protein H5410_031155 [Solanum commersonii]